MMMRTMMMMFVLERLEESGSHTEEQANCHAAELCAFKKTMQPPAVSGSPGLTSLGRLMQCMHVHMYILMYCIVLYCIVLHCIALPCLAVPCLALHCIVLCCCVLYVCT